MPQVPLYPAGGRVAPEARGPVYQSSAGASLEAFGSTGEGMQRASAKLDQASASFAAIAQEENERQAKQLDLELSKRFREIVSGDGTEQNPGFISTRGEATLNTVADTQKALAKARDEVLGTTNNPKVRQLVEPMSVQRLESSLGVVNSHTMEQRRAFTATVSEARIKEAASDVAAAWNDPAVMKRSMGIANGEILSLAKLNGWSEEVARQKLGEARAVIVEAGVKQAIAADNVEAAQAILDTNEKGLPAGARVELYTLLRNQSVEKQGQQLGDKLWAMFGNDVKGALAHLQGVATGKVRDAAWAQWQKIVDASQSKVERDRAAIRFKQEQDDRKNPVTGKAVQEYWTLWSRGLQVSEAARAAETRDEDAAAKAARNAWTTRILSGEKVDPAEIAKDEQLAKVPDWKAEIVRLAQAQADREDPTSGVAAMRAQAEYRRLREEGEALRLENERRQIRTATEARDEWTQQAMTNNGVIDTRALANDPRLSAKPEWRAELQNFAAQMAKEEVPAAVSRREMVDLFSRINLPEGDPEKITDMTPLVRAVGQGKLNKADYQFLEKTLVDAATPEGSRLGVAKKAFLDGFKSQITNSTPILGPDRNGDRNFYYFSKMVEEKVNEYRKAGKDPQTTLFNPQAPDFLGAPGIILQYQPTLQDQQRNMMEPFQRSGSGGALPGAQPVARDFKDQAELEQALRDKKISPAEFKAYGIRKGWYQ